METKSQSRIDNLTEQSLISINKKQLTNTTISKLSSPSKMNNLKKSTAQIPEIKYCNQNLVELHKEKEKNLLQNFNSQKEIEIQKLISKNMIEIRKNCHEHDVYLDHFCFDCGVGICKFCLSLPKHEKHLAVEKKKL